MCPPKTWTLLVLAIVFLALGASSIPTFYPAPVPGVGPDGSPLVKPDGSPIVQRDMLPYFRYLAAPVLLLMASAGAFGWWLNRVWRLVSRNRSQGPR